MPRAEIASKQAVYTLGLLHAELAGKLLANKREASRDLGLSYKTAFVLLHKLREAMAEEMKGRIVGGEGKEAAVDGGYFGGYVKPANM